MDVLFEFVYYFDRSILVSFNLIIIIRTIINSTSFVHLTPNSLREGRIRQSRRLSLYVTCQLNEPVSQPEKFKIQGISITNERNAKCFLSIKD